MYPKTVLLVAIICAFGIFGIQGQGFGFGRRNGGVPERGGYGNPSNGRFGNVPQNGNFGGFQQNSGRGSFGGFPQNSDPYSQNSGIFSQQPSGGFRPPQYPGRF